MCLTAPALQARRKREGRCSTDQPKPLFSLACLPFWGVALTQRGLKSEHGPPLAWDSARDSLEKGCNDVGCELWKMIIIDLQYRQVSSLKSGAWGIESMFMYLHHMESQFTSALEGIYPPYCAHSGRDVLTSCHIHIRNFYDINLRGSMSHAREIAASSSRSLRSRVVQDQQYPFSEP